MPTASDVDAGGRVDHAVDSLADAAFVRVVAPATGDGVAAGATLARAIADRGVPFQIETARTVEARAVRVARATDRARPGDRTVALGAGADDTTAEVTLSPSGPLSRVAADVADRLTAEVDNVLALAGTIAAGGVPTATESDRLDAAREVGRLDRRPGVGLPTTDLVDGLAHSTLVHAPFSGDPTAAARAVEGVCPTEVSSAPEATGHRDAASLMALSVAGTSGATDRAGVVVERALRPHVTDADAPFDTLEGYADVLDATARTAPGTATALALGHDAEDYALDVWRDHARAVHDAVEDATTKRFDGLLVARVADPPVDTLTRLLRDFRSPEPVVLVVGDRRAGAAAVDTDLRGPTVSAADAVEGNYDAASTGRQTRVEYDTENADPAALVSAFREVLE